MKLLNLVISSLFICNIIIGQGIYPNQLAPAPDSNMILKSKGNLLNAFDYEYINAGSGVNPRDSTVLESGYGIYTYEVSPNVWIVEIDTTEFNCTDSLIYAGDSLYLRDGSGYYLTPHIYTTDDYTYYWEIPNPHKYDLFIQQNTTMYYNKGNWHYLDGDNDKFNELQAIELLDSINRVFRLNLDHNGGIVKWKDSNPSDSTTVVNGYGTIITETPANQFNIKVDSSKFATPFDLTLKQNVINAGFGIGLTNETIYNSRYWKNQDTVKTTLNGTLKSTAGVLSSYWWKSIDTLNVADGLVLATSKKLSAVTNNSANWNTAYSRSVSTWTTPLQFATGTASILQSGAAQSGYLSSTDWTTFNNKFTLPSLTSGSVLFSNGSTISQDNSNFFWDNTDKKLGININSTLGAKLHINLSSGQYDFNYPFQVYSYNGTNIFRNYIESTWSTIFESLQHGTDESALKFKTNGVIRQTIANNGQITLSNLAGTGNRMVIANSTGVLSTRELPTATIGGSGVTNRIPYFSDTYTLTSASTLTRESSGDITVNSVNIGLGGGSIASNTRIGLNALTSNTTGAINVAVGQNALYSNSTGQECIAVGQNALYNNNNNYNIAIGRSSLFTNTTGEYNLGIGAYSLYFNSSGSFNVGIGANSCAYTLGNNNSGIGYATLYSNTTGGGNTGLGFNTAYSNTTGDYNTAMGYRALFSNSTGSGNIAIGANAGYSETGSNRLYIENTTSATPLIGGQFDNNRVGINTAIADLSEALHVTGNARITSLAGTGTRLSTSSSTGVFGNIANGTGLLYNNGSGAYTWVAGALPALTDGKIWIGNSLNAASERTLSGDATMDNMGVVTVGNDSHTHNASTIIPNIVSSVENVANDGGNIDLVGDGISITGDDTNNKITFAQNQILLKAYASDSTKCGSYAWRKIKFNNDTYNIGTFIINPTNYTIQVPSVGLYEIETRIIYVNNNTANETISSRILVNGSVIANDSNPYYYITPENHLEAKIYKTIVFISNTSQLITVEVRNMFNNNMFVSAGNYPTIMIKKLANY